MTPMEPATINTPAMRRSDPMIGPDSPPLVWWRGVTMTLHCQWGRARPTIPTTIQMAGPTTRTRASRLAPRKRTSRIRRPRVFG